MRLRHQFIGATLILAVAILNVSPVAAVPGQPLRLFGSVTAPVPDAAVVASVPGVSCVKAVSAGGGEYVLNVPADDPDTSRKEGAFTDDLVSVFADSAQPSTISFPGGGGFEELQVVASTSQYLSLNFAVSGAAQTFTVTGTIGDGATGAPISGASVNVNWGDGTDCS